MRDYRVHRGHGNATGLGFRLGRKDELVPVSLNLTTNDAERGLRRIEQNGEDALLGDGGHINVFAREAVDKNSRVQLADLMQQSVDLPETGNR